MAQLVLRSRPYRCERVAPHLEHPPERRVSIRGVLQLDGQLEPARSQGAFARRYRGRACSGIWEREVAGSSGGAGDAAKLLAQFGGMLRAPHGRQPDQVVHVHQRRRRADGLDGRVVAVEEALYDFRLLLWHRRHVPASAGRAFRPQRIRCSPRNHTHNTGRGGSGDGGGSRKEESDVELGCRTVGDIAPQQVVCLGYQHIVLPHARTPLGPFEHLDQRGRAIDNLRAFGRMR